MHVLFADDLLDTRELYAMAFHLDGHTITLAEDGAEAVQAVAEQAFEVIIMDGYMPGMDGLTAIKRIRKLPNGQSVPIILLTAYDCSEQQAQEVGANLLLRKPILLRNLLEQVKQLHSNSQLHLPRKTPATFTLNIGGSTQQWKEIQSEK